MQNVSVYELGLRFVSVSVEYYNEVCPFLLLYAAAVLFVFLKGDKRIREIFLPGAVMLLLTVYNPVFPIVIDRFFDVNKEYYRFFWITPVIVLVPYAAALFTELPKKNWRRLMAAMAVLLFIGVTGRYIYASGYARAETKYSMPQELLDVSRELHRVSETENPKAMMEYQYNMMIRQYDPSILLAVDREIYINGVSYEITDEQMNAEEDGLEYRLIDVIIRGERLDREYFLEALEGTHTEFIVVSSGNLIQDYLLEMGLTEAGRTKDHIIYRYDLKERENPYADHLHSDV